MKFLKFSFLILTGFFVFAACSSSVDKNVENQQIHRKWMMTEYKNFTKEELKNLNAYMDLTKKSDGNQYGAKMGCNGILFSAEFKNRGSVKFSKGLSTMMYCDGKMNLEYVFGKDLPNMNRYKIDGHFLTLTGGNSTMKFVAEDWD